MLAVAAVALLAASARCCSPRAQPPRGAASFPSPSACGADEPTAVGYCVSSCELAIRKPAPEWAGKAVVNDAIVDLSSSSLKGKWVVLFFYPLDFTFVCPTEIVEFNNKLFPPCAPLYSERHSKFTTRQDSMRERHTHTERVFTSTLCTCADSEGER